MNRLLIPMLSTLMLSLSRILLAHLSQSDLFLTDPVHWIKSHDKLLKFCDELLAITAFLFSGSIISFVLYHRQDDYFMLAIISVSLIYCIFAWIGTVLIIGNSIYPVNGLKALKESELPKALLQIYSRLHLSDLSLGILTIALSNLNPNLYIRLSGYAVGPMQILFTYYSKPLKYKTYIFTVIAWTIWMILFQLTTN
ncbi:hypothetical protein ACFSN5_03605 [Streptococcus tangpeifui]|uniref:hypothetical protein n=1 Tax=Streptococcus tangpeifui TaxID=2709400 RepID=UPI0013EA7634|nr:MULTISPECIES: hypothetical protein [unclassified Streptococcus]